ncbi:hypothetical protein SFA35_25045 (plasmid) [Pseudomonas sp. HR96]|uniref:hypothetical protein n=1 Tax=Pseudomonas sp. HR96 TaxID=1027966 RepID=UPI002A766627|nr:hypothetical protein [Pseudomonas sp. HR96]WPP02438.1 hypothetical protein SFA35_25045 [Pseudomonas sp. HR96]
MTVELTEEDMRQALFGAAQAPAPQVTIHDPMAHIPDVVIVPPAVATAGRKKKRGGAFTLRMRVTLQVGNVFEGATQAYVHEADTISRLLAEQEAVKVARKKYRYVEVVSVMAIGEGRPGKITDGRDGPVYF